MIGSKVGIIDQRILFISEWFAGVRTHKVPRSKLKIVQMLWCFLQWLVSCSVHFFDVLSISHNIYYDGEIILLVMYTICVV